MAKRPGLRWKSVSLKGARRLTAGLQHHRSPAFSPDGQWLAFAVGEGRQSMWVVTDRRGRVARALEGPAEGGCAFSPDGALAFGRRPGPVGELWLMPAGGVPPVRLLGGDGLDYREPAFSPDGRMLAFVAGAPGGAAHLELLEVASGARRALASDSARADRWPAFSPDGGELFFEATSEGETSIWALTLGSGVLQRVTVSGAPSRRPAPLSRDLVVVERGEPDGGERTRLVLVDRIEVRERELAVEPPGDGANGTNGVARPPAAVGREQREPSVHRTRSGKARIAFVARSMGEGRRDEICVARLKGVSLAAEVRPVEPVEAAPPAEPAPAGTVG